MNSDDRFSDEKLHLFIDDELDSVDRAEIMEALGKDDKLSYRICGLLTLKDSVRLAYSDLPASGREIRVPGSRFRSGAWQNAMAASLLLAIGAAGGWMLIPQPGLFEQADRTTASIAPAGSAVVQQTDRIILHISKSDPAQFSNVLAYVRDYLDKHKSDGSQIEVVANAGGLDFMRKDKSPYRDQIAAIMREHDNVHFVACTNAIRMLRNKGIEPVIIKGVGKDKTAFDHIVERLQSGWTYIKVDTLSES